LGVALEKDREYSDANKEYGIAAKLDPKQYSGYKAESPATSK
jgi:hypothetical protein